MKKFFICFMMLAGTMLLQAQVRRTPVQRTQPQQRATAQAAAKTFTLTNGKLGPIQTGIRFANIPATYTGLYDKYTYKKETMGGEGGDEWHFDVVGADIVAPYGPQAIPLESLSIESITVTDTTITLVVSAVPEDWLVDNAKSLRVRASAILPLPTGDDALLPAADVTAELNQDGTVTLTFPRTNTETMFYRVEGE